MQKNEDCRQAEREFLSILYGLEDLAEKKIKIYSRLLTDTEIAKQMEELALRHEKRKIALESLAFGKSKKKEVGEAGNSAEEEEE